MDAAPEGFVCSGESQYFGPWRSVPSVGVRASGLPLQLLGVLCRTHPDCGYLLPRNFGIMRWGHIATPLACM